MAKRIVLSIVFFILTLYGLNHAIFERKFFFNELLSLVGIAVFLYQSLKKPGYFILPKSKLYRIMIVYLALAFTHLVVSVFWKTNWYYYIRNSVIFYSGFCFFLGFYYYKYAVAFFRQVKFGLYSFFLVAFVYPIPMFLLDRYTGTVFFPFLFKNKTLKNLLGIFLFVVLSFIYAFTYKSSTIIFTAAFIALVLFIKKYIYVKLVLLSAFLAITIFFISIFPVLKLYKTGDYSLFGNVYYVYKQNPVLQLDNNSSWRLILWYRVIVEKFPNNLFGLGYGTPLLTYKENKNTSESPYSDKHDAHVIGVHNTYITVAVRLGVIYLLILYAIYSTTLREFYYFRNYYFSSDDAKFFIGFFAVTIVGLFNLVIESPIVAALYWTLLGFLAKIIQNRKKYSLQKDIVNEKVFK